MNLSNFLLRLINSLVFGVNLLKDLGDNCHPPRAISSFTECPGREISGCDSNLVAWKDSYTVFWNSALATTNKPADLNLPSCLWIVGNSFATVSIIHQMIQFIFYHCKRDMINRSQTSRNISIVKSNFCTFNENRDGLTCGYMSCQYAQLDFK